MMPMPPTISEIAAVAPSSHVNVCCAAVRAFIDLVRLRTTKVSSSPGGTRRVLRSNCSISSCASVRLSLLPYSLQILADLLADDRMFADDLGAGGCHRYDNDVVMILTKARLPFWHQRTITLNGTLRMRNTAPKGSSQPKSYLITVWPSGLPVGSPQYPSVTRDPLDQPIRAVKYCEMERTDPGRGYPSRAPNGAEFAMSFRIGPWKLPRLQIGRRRRRPSHAVGLHTPAKTSPATSKASNEISLRFTTMSRLLESSPSLPRAILALSFLHPEGPLAAKGGPLISSSGNAIREDDEPLVP